MKRTLMFENRELLDFEVEPETGEARVLNAPEAGNEELAAIGLDCSDLDAALTKLIRMRSMSSNRVDLDAILEGFGAISAPFDYDGAFGFPNNECLHEAMCANPQSARCSARTASPILNRRGTGGGTTRAPSRVSRTASLKPMLPSVICRPISATW